MAGGGSRGIHAARPTPRHLRSACTQVAMCGPPSMAGGGSRGIHAARPTPRHLRSACTQVAMCGV
ncbi:hypothetical protein BWR59_12955 [Pseudomonas sp. Bc-h]|nr:hypothetical protein BWR59_12955 [Pseudomonas sp. Bc-h]